MPRPFVLFLAWARILYFLSYAQTKITKITMITMITMIIAKGAAAVAGLEKTSGAAERSSHRTGVRQVPGNDKI